MPSHRIEALRSVALEVPDLAHGEDFYTGVWQLEVADRTPDALYLHARGTDHHVLSLHRGERLAIRNVTLRARHAGALADIAAGTLGAGGRVLVAPGPADEPGGGTAVTVRDPDGRIVRVVHGDERRDINPDPDRPVRLAHVVLNSRHVDVSRGFYEQVMDFRMSDRTKIMAFMNCDRDHHSLALGDADNDALNHIAFLMPDLDAVMRGGGRMGDADLPVQWGPGRHGPGNNAFNYFIGPFGEVIEYTAEVEQIDESYRTGSPDDWQWPPRRIDRWGIAYGPTPALKQAQRSVFFIPT